MEQEQVAALIGVAIFFFIAWIMARVQYRDTRHYQTKILQENAEKQREMLEQILLQQTRPTLPDNFTMRQQQEMLEQMVRPHAPTSPKRDDSGYTKFLIIMFLVGLFTIFYYFYGK